MATDNAIRGQLLSGPTFTAMVGTEIGGTFTSLFLSIDGHKGPEALEFDYDQVLELHEQLGKAIKEIRERMG